jgi:hypothetical protein
MIVIIAAHSGTLKFCGRIREKILTGIRIAIRVPLNISSFQLILREFGLIRVKPEKMSILITGAFLYKFFNTFCNEF